MPRTDKQNVDTVRILSAEAVQAAKAESDDPLLKDRKGKEEKNHGHRKN